MIYDVYFDGLTVVGENTWNPDMALWGGFDTGKFLADYIKSGKSNDSFVFITTTNQESRMQSYMEKHGLKDFLSYEMPYAVTNNNHPGDGRKLRLRVFQSKKEAA